MYCFDECIPKRSHFTDSETSKIVARFPREENQTQAEVTESSGVSKNGIFRIWNHFLEAGNVGQRPGQGFRCATTHNENRYHANGSETYVCHSSSTTSSLGYWHPNFDTNCPKAASRYRSVCSLTNGMSYVKSKALSRPQGVGNRTYELEEK